MNVDICTLIQSPDYDFLRTHERLKRNIVLLTLGGSYAYGTNVETSDIDIRGCALNSKSDLLGLSQFDHFEHNATDTKIYSFNKFINLLSNCNPSIIEMLGCKPEHYFLLTPIGKEILDNKKMFLSKKAVKSFGGYATQQFRKLENALAKGYYPQQEKERHILASCENIISGFNERYAEFPEGAITLNISPAQNPDLETEIFVDVNLKHYPLRDYKNILADFKDVVDNYNKLNHRNAKRDAVHLNKHAMHLIRLYLMCIDILEKEDVITYREDDREFLLSIRNGQYQKPDGTYKSEFFELVDKLEKRMQYASKNTSLPEKPNHKQIEEFVISVNERVVRNHGNPDWGL